MQLKSTQFPINFKGQNLAGKSFKGRDFSHINALAALSKFLLVLIASSMSGFLQALSGFIVVHVGLKGLVKILGSHQVSFLTVFGLLLFILVGIYVYFIRKGVFGFLVSGLGMLGTIATLVILSIALGFAYELLETAIDGVGVLIEITGAVGLAAITLVVSSLLMGLTITFSIAGCGIIVGGVSVLVAIVIAVMVAFADLRYDEHQVIMFYSFVIVLVCSYCLSAYIAYCAYYKDPQFSRWWRLGLAFGAWGNVDFSGANLSAADCSSANFWRVKLKDATLVRTNFREAKNLEWADVRNTILENPKIRDLLVTGQGSRQSFAGSNMEGAYLYDAGLSRCDLSDVKLNRADCRRADLRDANLTRVQAIGTDFRGAVLTGACLENWTTDHSTLLEDIECEFVYLQHDRKMRRPPEGINYKQGEFSKLYSKAINTVELILQNNYEKEEIFNNVIKDIQTEYDMELGAKIEVVSVENKDGTWVAKLKIPDHIKEKIKQNEKLQSQLNENQIAILGLADKLANVAAKQADNMSNRREHVNIHIEGNVNGNVVLAETISNSFNSLQQTKVEPEVKQLFEQLLAEIKAVNSKVSSEELATLKDITTDVNALIDEARRSKPRKDRYEFTLKGIKDAALSLGEIADPIISVVQKLTPLLLGVF